MTDISQISVFTAFLAGVISFLSPCVLPLVPAYVSYVAGQSFEQVSQEHDKRQRLRTATLGLFFVLGFSTVFVALGASATALGGWLLKYRYETNLIGGIIIIIFGLFLSGAAKLPWLQRDSRIHMHLKGGHPMAAYLLGLAFAFGWTPCIGPVLGAILTMSTVSPAASAGVALLAIYSLGLGLPFLLAAAFTGRFLARMKLMRRIGGPLQIAAGLIMVLMGIAMITGQLSTFAYWLLQTFPALGSIG